MAVDKHVQRLLKGSVAWGRWRHDFPLIHPDLSGADLSGTKLHGVDLSAANLSDANLSAADLSYANLPAPT